VQRITRVANAMDSGFAAYRNVDPALVADVNRSGAVTMADATLLSQEVQFLMTGNAAFDRPEIPPIPAGLRPLVIDLSSKLAVFSLNAANEDALGVNGESWKKQLAGSYTPAVASANPNSKLCIPVSLAASKAVAKV